MDTHGTLVLVRHGESTANAAQTFTGLIDVDLSPLGVRQAHDAARLLALDGFRPDDVVTSPLTRARRTTSMILRDLGVTRAPRSCWRLEERDYGCLAGMAKRAVAEQFGPEQFFTWRRTVDGRPPAASPDQVATWRISSTRPAGLPAPGEGESLRDVIDRVRPCWSEQVLPGLRAGHRVLVVAHGNSLRALSSIIDDLSAVEVASLNLPPAQPLRYDVTAAGLLRPRGGRYLDDPAARAAAEQIAREGGT